MTTHETTKLEWRPATIQIIRGEEGHDTYREPVHADRYGPVAVHRTKDSRPEPWTLTHVPSGMRVVASETVKPLVVVAEEIVRRAGHLGLMAREPDDETREIVTDVLDEMGLL